MGHRWLIAGMLLAEATARADGPDYVFTPQTAEDAARAVSAPIAPVRLLETRVSYATIDSGGNSTALELRLIAPIPYVLIPGVRIPHLETLLRVDLHLASVNTPQGSASGLGDTPAFDVALWRSKRWAVGVGLGAVFPTATNPHLGTGKLQLGPAVGVAVSVVPGIFSVIVLTENLFSVAGDPMRADIDTLVVQPFLVLLLPRAFFLMTNPVMTFDWERSGHASIPVNLAVGHAFTKHLALSVQPEWIATGDRQNDVTVHGVLDYVGW